MTRANIFNKNDWYPVKRSKSSSDKLSVICKYLNHTNKSKMTQPSIFNKSLKVILRRIKTSVLYM